MTPQTFVFIGRSGCGKGTQVSLLIEHIKSIDPEKRPFFHMEAGARFREFIQNDSYSAKLAKEVSDKGDRQPDFLAVWNWSHLVVDNFTGKEHLIIDGTPRSLEEAYVLGTAFTFYKREKPMIMHIKVSNEWSMARMLARKRQDDYEANIKKRLEWFDRDVLPAVDYYRTNPAYNFIEINGEQTIEEVQKEILEKTGLVS